MKEYMKIALEEARNGTKNQEGGPFGAVIVKEDQIIGRGHNRVLKKHDPTAHAEIEAIRDACQKLESENLSGAVIYTTGYPCPMCMSALAWSNIKEIYYLNSKEEIAQIGFKDDFLYTLLKEPEKYMDITKIEDAEGKELLENYQGKLY